MEIGVKEISVLIISIFTTVFVLAKLLNPRWLEEGLVCLTAFGIGGVVVTIGIVAALLAQPKASHV